MATTATQVKQVAPEFSSLDDSAIDPFITYSENYVALSFWGEDRYDFIHALMTAHFLKLLGVASGTSGASGPVASERVGDLSVTYAVNAVSGSDLSSTTYGSIIEQLKKSIIKTPIGY